MKRTLLVTLEIGTHEDISAYADEVLSILTEEGLPVTAVVPWGQVATQPEDDGLGQSPLPISPAQPETPPAFVGDPWLP